MGFFSFLLLAAVAYFVWRISDQLPDLLFRISEIQRDVADVRKQLLAASETKTAAKPAKKPTRKKAAAKRPAKKAEPQTPESTEEKPDSSSDT